MAPRLFPSEKASDNPTGCHLTIFLQTTGTSNTSTEVDPAIFQSITLTMPEAGGLAEINLLRLIAWLASNHLLQPVMGEALNPDSRSHNPTVWLDVEELGLHGLATVKEIAPCPPIDPGPGRVITGTIRHASAEILDLRVKVEPTLSAELPVSAKPKKTGALRAAALGLLALAAPLTTQAVAEVQPSDAPALIQTTGAHPFWSETRQAWVPARELRAGEALRTQSGAAATVASLARQPGSQPVFNLEVETEHVYFVGEAGVLVHNFCGSQNLHHTICKTMGGSKNQKFLAKLSKQQHVDLHKQIDAELAKAGIPLGTRGGTGNGYQDWDRWMKLSPGNQQKALDVLDNVYRQFDAKNSTSVWQSFQNELINGSYTLYP